VCADADPAAARLRRQLQKEWMQKVSAIQRQLDEERQGRSREAQAQAQAVHVRPVSSRARLCGLTLGGV
jgi:hypothetical protein